MVPNKVNLWEQRCVPSWHQAHSLVSGNLRWPLRCKNTTSPPGLFVLIASPRLLRSPFPDNLARGQIRSDDLLYLVWLSLAQMRPPSHAPPIHVRLCLISLDDIGLVTGDCRCLHDLLCRMFSPLIPVHLLILFFSTEQ